MDTLKQTKVSVYLNSNLTNSENERNRINIGLGELLV